MHAELLKKAASLAGPSACPDSYARPAGGGGALLSGAQGRRAMKSGTAAATKRQVTLVTRERTNKGEKADRRTREVWSLFPCLIKKATGQEETGSPPTQWACFRTSENLESQQLTFPVLAKSMRKFHSNKLEKNSYL